MSELTKAQAAHEEAVDDRERLRFELFEWRRRAIEAEKKNAEWDAWRARLGWRLYMAILALRGRLAPAGSRRSRLSQTIVDGLLDQVRALPSRTPDRQAPTGKARLAKAAVFVSGLTGDTRRYRCNHQGEAFGLAGGTFDVRLARDVDLLELVDQYECFVLHRVPWEPAVERFIECAHDRRKRVIFDADDLVFDPGAADFLPLEQMGEAERLLLLDGLHLCRRTLESCDAVTVSTDSLLERARRIHDRVAVTYNVVSAEMVEAADVVLSHRAAAVQSRNVVTIAYLSGTPTHDRDFREAADAVLWALETFPHVRFLAVGFVSLDARFEKYTGRVERLPIQPWRRLPEILASVDINLAPLVPDSPFTDAKSCVKYLEAGLLGVPTIASPRPDFARAIENGVNGLLAEGFTQWRGSVQRLVESEGLGHRLGQAASEDVRRNHTTRARSRPIHDTLTELASRDSFVKPPYDQSDSEAQAQDRTAD